MKHIKNKLLFIMVPLSLIPMLLIGSVSYVISTRVLQKNINTASLLMLQQISLNVDAKTEKILKYLDILFSNEKLQSILTGVDFVHQTGNTLVAYRELDAIIGSLTYKDRDIRAAIIFSFLGGKYIYKGYLPDTFNAPNESWFKEVEKKGGQTVWIGEIPNPDALNKEQDVFAVGRVIKDTAFKQNINTLGMAVFFLGDGFLTDLYRDVDINSLGTIIITDSEGRLLTPAPENHKGDLRAYAFGDLILKENSGYFQQKVNGEDLMISYNTSKITGWKIIRMIPYSYFVRDIRLIGWITAGLALAFLAVIWLLALIMAGRISNPLKKLALAMKQVGDKDLNISIPVTTKDEVGLICNGFNSMVQDLKNMVDTILKEEKEKRRISLRSLKYQINPHFLYNTLTSVRFLAVADKSGRVAEMIMVLSRLLRNTISKVDQMITVQEEINNLKDYITLQQIRYKDRLGLSYEISGDVLQHTIPGMLLQPLVENSIEHGLGDALVDDDCECLIRISAFEQEGQLIFEVWDNGSGMTQKQIMDVFNENYDAQPYDTVHIGVKNIHDRLSFQFGAAFGITIQSVPEKFTCMRLNLPILHEKEVQLA